ncbi:MAG: diguanylate cyclase [Pseudomonadota bacterium]
MYPLLQDLLNDPAFMPHGHCFLWTPALLTLFVIADTMIAAAYFAIPLGLIFFVRRRVDFPYKPLLWLFGAFITLCGITHVLGLWNIWNSSYWLEAWLKFLTGAVSVATAIVLFPLIPKALSLPSRADLTMANTALRAKLQELETTQSALADSEQRYRQLAETAREGIWLIDKAGNTVFANQRLGEMLGRQPQEMLGLPLLDFIEADDRDAMREQLALQLDEQVNAQLSAYPASQTLLDNMKTFRLRHQDGSVLHTIFSTSTVRERNGACNGILGVVTDITEREKIARDLSQLTAKLEHLVSERTDELAQANTVLLREIAQHGQVQGRLQAVLDAAVDGIIVADVRGRILTTNPAVEKIFQYTDQESLGQPLTLFMPEPFHREHESYISNYLRTGDAKVIGIGREVVGLRRDGTEFPLDLAVGVIHHEDTTQFVGIVRDISERKAAQQEILTLNEKLSRTNTEMQVQIKEREQALQDLDLIHGKLETTLTELRQKSDNTSVLNEMSELLQAAIDLHEVGAIMQPYCSRLFAADAGNLLFVDGDNGSLVTVFAWGDQSECEEEIVHQRCWALRQAKPYPTTKLQRDLRCAHLHTGEGRETICLPLFGQGEALGLLALRGGRALADIVMAHGQHEYRSELLAFTEQVSLAMANIRLRERLHDESVRDPLTGLFNRRYLNHELLRLWASMRNNDQVLAVLMIDVDHFKQVNDNYGHDTGDSVLCDLARRLLRSSRPGDVLARFGGEEFVMILPGAEQDIAERRAVDICAKQAGNAVRLPNGTDLKVTISIGVATARRSEQGVDTALLLSRADQALYSAKEAGRNRVEVYRENPP